MKSFIPNEHKSRTIANIIVVAAGMAMLAILIYAKSIGQLISGFVSILSPFLLGAGLSFLQLPIVRKVEEVLNKTLFRRKRRPKLERIISVLFSFTALIFLIASFLRILVPQIVDSLKSLGVFISGFIQNNAGRLDELLSQYEFFDFLSFDGEELVITWGNVLSNLTNYIDFIYQNLSTISSTVYSTVLEVFVGAITAIYILFDKERFSAQAKKLCYATMNQENCETLIYWMRRASKIFAGFISGKIIDSIIIGILCYLGMLLIGLEYPLLISVIIGVTNVIPFFGPFIGAIPSILILLIINPYSALWFTLFIIFLQQLDGNVIGPLILGDSVGITPLWIMVSIVVGGDLFGLVGMLLSVPVFAVCYALVKTALEGRLRVQGMPTETNAYMDAPESFHPGEDLEAAAIRHNRPSFPMKVPFFLRWRKKNSEKK